jgi:hypothetical protein
MISLWTEALKPWQVRLFSYLLVDDGCWAWTGHHHVKDLYARYSVAKGLLDPDKAKELYVHKYLYELLIGPVPEGMELDHLCKNRRCPNPWHLEPVSHTVNLRRGKNAGICKRGHALEGNRKTWGCGRSCCLTCYNDNLAKARAARLALGKKRGRPRKVN